MGLTCLRAAALALLLGFGGASNADPSQRPYPRDYHLYDELRSFDAPSIEAIKGESYRLAWHAWHKTPGLVLANCDDDDCRVEVRFTDGYGTYSQGTLQGTLQHRISRAEFDTVAMAFEQGGFAQLEPWLRPGEPYLGVSASQEDDDLPICLHSPHYYLEQRKAERQHLIYRYCQRDYADGLELAMPLIELAERYFPDEMAKIVAVWLEEERKAGK